MNNHSPHNKDSLTKALGDEGGGGHVKIKAKSNMDELLLNIKRVFGIIMGRKLV